jgi:hypothetical protein
MNFGGHFDPCFFKTIGPYFAQLSIGPVCVSVVRGQLELLKQNEQGIVRF